MSALFLLLTRRSGADDAVDSSLVRSAPFQMLVSVLPNDDHEFVFFAKAGDSAAQAVGITSKGTEIFTSVEIGRGITTGRGHSTSDARWKALRRSISDVIHRTRASGAAPNDVICIVREDGRNKYFPVSLDDLSDSSLSAIAACANSQAMASRVPGIAANEYATAGKKTGLLVTAMAAVNDSVVVTTHDSFVCRYEIGETEIETPFQKSTEIEGVIGGLFGHRATARSVIVSDDSVDVLWELPQKFKNFRFAIESFSGNPLKAQSQKLSIPDSSISSATMNESGQLLLRTQTGVVYSTSIETPDSHTKLDNLPSQLEGCVLSPSGRFAVVQLKTGSVQLWDRKQNRAIRSFEGEAVKVSATFSPDSSSVLIRRLQNDVEGKLQVNILLAKTSDSSEVKRLRPYHVGNASLHGDIQWSPDSRFVLTTGAHSGNVSTHRSSMIHVWAKQDGRHVCDLSAPKRVRRFCVNKERGSVIAWTGTGELAEWMLRDVAEVSATHH